jgi:hypothetical protein
MDYAEFAVGWEALADVDTDDAHWAPVFSVQPDFDTANTIAHQLRELHATNPLVRNVGVFGRPAKPAWEALDLAEAPAPLPAVVIDGQPVNPADLLNPEGNPDGP